MYRPRVDATVKPGGLTGQIAVSRFGLTHPLMLCFSMRISQDRLRPADNECHDDIITIGARSLPDTTIHLDEASNGLVCPIIRDASVRCEGGLLQ